MDYPEKENKYDAINLDALVRGVQDSANMIEQMKERKSTKTKSFAARINELRLMRESACRRLLLRERNHPSFFPLRCIVLYQPESGIYRQIQARVEDYEENRVIIRPLGADHIIKVWPKDIIIHNLRERY